ncbi:hypothetical protein BBO99_00003613 [Phytophthora kernoviae]|uniref:Uncharacterized protein n=2 Tax=Phytophthora kernoviae TaxID=325452 RepID=A0A421GTB9_9STRA|nr:hypothetical protein G195_008249 [Phytophthora kernoviae 00238/432]KAG2520661.1 hypothetical protein JM16_005652 [Phytophthora kernoviae]KAG2530093.1 hypothetical protein JM18_002502 [Phytophthora kernoviae]RLN81553.1 hypothetical protein BBO99_00003613 [Phytophthora kernoviae]
MCLWSSAMYDEPLLDKRSVYDDVERKQLQQEDRDEKVDLGSVIHQLNSFFAVLWPVSIAIVCSSLSASYIHDPVMKKAMTTYMYYQDIDSSELSATAKTGEALFNALLVIIFIAFLTFGIVLLYKCNGFWDLFAVLTPVGPLRCLVDLVQEKGTPIPGLLFEADVEESHVGETAAIQGASNGLAVTLYLLARFDALPALPISLFLGITIYLLTLNVITPMLDALHASSVFGI